LDRPKPKTPKTGYWYLVLADDGVSVAQHLGKFYIFLGRIKSHWYPKRQTYLWLAAGWLPALLPAGLPVHTRLITKYETLRERGVYVSILYKNSLLGYEKNNTSTSFESHLRRHPSLTAPAAVDGLAYSPTRATPPGDSKILETSKQPRRYLATARW